MWKNSCCVFVLGALWFVGFVFFSLGMCLVFLPFICDFNPAAITNNHNTNNHLRVKKS